MIGGLYFRLGLTEATLFEDSSAPNGCYALPKTSGIAAKAVEAQEQASLIHAFQDAASMTAVTMLSAKAQHMLELKYCNFISTTSY